MGWMEFILWGLAIIFVGPIVATGVLAIALVVLYVLVYVLVFPILLLVAWVTSK